MQAATDSTSYDTYLRICASLSHIRKILCETGIAQASPSACLHVQNGNIQTCVLKATRSAAPVAATQPPNFNNRALLQPMGREARAESVLGAGQCQVIQIQTACRQMLRSEASAPACDSAEHAYWMLQSKALGAPHRAQMEA